jgi:PEP-CTERM motif
MTRILWIGTTCFLCGVVAVLTADVARAGTIIKLDLGGDSSTDVGFDGTNLSTLNDGDAATLGDQNTGVGYLDILSPLTDIPSSLASFSLHGLKASGLATQFGGLVIQNFTGGTFELYGPAPTNVLLLTGALANSALAGPLGPPATGALFTTSFASVTGGTLQSALDVGNLTLSMTLSNINNGAGLSVGAAAPALNPFFADTTLNLADTGPGLRGNGPEPSTFVLAMIGVTSLGAFARSRRDVK